MTTVKSGGSTLGNLADKLTSSHRASREEAEQSDASMLKRETSNNNLKIHGRPALFVILNVSVCGVRGGVGCELTLEVKSEARGDVLK